MMATNDNESSAVGTDNRPPMLEEINFDSWKIRTERYIRGECEQQTQVIREKTNEEFTEAENNKERAEIQAINILSQDVECTVPYAEPLAITTTTSFKVSHEDAYDYDVDEAPHAATVFMANLIQTGPLTGQGSIN
nr:hypothetical protein [Tanacetum cinerariifolium]